MRRAAPLLSISALLVASAAVQARREYIYPLGHVRDSSLYLTSGRTAEKLALSYDAVVADAYWIRAIQHYGDERLNGGQQRFALLYPLLDVTTSLDPRFSIAYRFGAFFLAEPFPGGAGRADQAIALLEKGLRAQPEKWEYLEDIGFIYYWQLRDFHRAAEAFAKAAEIPRAPWWLRPLAATMLAKGGQRQASRFLWAQILEGAGDDWQRRTARTRLLQLDALDGIDMLRDAAGRYRHETGRWPESWSELASAGLVRTIPHDPAGSPYVLDPGTGGITVSTTSPLYPLPVEPPSKEAPRL